MSNDPNYSLFDSTFVERVLNKKDVKTPSEVVVEPPHVDAEPPAAAISEPTRIFSPSEQEFARNYPGEWEWIQSSSFDFAVSMCGVMRRYGRLTDNQMNAVRRCMRYDSRIARQNTARIQAVIDNGGGEIPF